MKKVLLLMALFAVTGIASANLLSNGDFETPAADGWTDTGWTEWSWGNGWSEHTIKYNDETNGWNGGNGTYLLNAGGMSWSGGGGAYQIVAVTEGTTYQLTVDSGADKWWLPTGYMKMFWLDSSNAEIGNAIRTTVDPAVYVDYDIEHPMQSYSLIATAPVGATQVKVEFAGNDLEGGSVTFDNAVLEVVPEPTTLTLLGLGGLVIRRRR